MLGFMINEHHMRRPKLPHFSTVTKHMNAHSMKFLKVLLHKKISLMINSKMTSTYCDVQPDFVYGTLNHRPFRAGVTSISNV